MATRHSFSFRMDRKGNDDEFFGRCALSVFGVADLRQLEYRRRHDNGAWIEASVDERRPERPVTQAEASAILERQRQIEALLRRPAMLKRQKLGRVCHFASCDKTLIPEQRRFCSRLHADANRQRERRRLQSARRAIAQLAPRDHALIASVVDRDSYIVALKQIANGRQERKLPYRIRMTTPYTTPSAFAPQAVVEEISRQTHWQDAGYRGDPEIIACKLHDEKRHGDLVKLSWALFVPRGLSDEDNGQINQAEYRGPHDFISVTIGIVSDEATIAESIKDQVARLRH